MSQREDRDEQRRRDRRRAAEAGGWRPLTVVWCEDDEMLSAMLDRTWRLEDPDAAWRPHPEDRLLFTSDGDEALVLVEEHDADLFVSDECHPGSMGGLELLRALRHRHGLALGYFTGFPVTGPADDHGAWARELGVDLLLGKPVWMGDFLAELVPLVARLRDGTWQPLPARGIGPRIRPRES